MNVISVSRRTDIPALYWRWFMRRLDEGYCHWVNPFNATQVFRVPLGPKDVAAFVFWTRFAGPMLRDVGTLTDRGYTFYVQYTLNDYPAVLENRSPRLEPSLRALMRLADATSPDRVIWRYDPVIFSSATPPEYHLERFAEIAGRLAGATRSAYISFCDPYDRTRRHFERLTRSTGIIFETGTKEQHAQLAADLGKIAHNHGMRLFSCAEAGLVADGVQAGSCIDARLLAALRPDLEFKLKPAPTREACGCVQAVDIGAFDTCVFGCEYCYANRSAGAALQRRKQHDPGDSILWRSAALRGVDLGDPSVSREQKSAKIERRTEPAQLSMLDGQDPVG